MKLSWILLFVIYISSIGTASAGSKGGVNKNMVTLAKALYASSRNGFGDNKYIFNKVDIVEVGKNLGRGLPIKFKMKGIRGYKTQSSPPPGWNPNGSPVWVGETIEAEKPFSDTFVVFYTKNEFGKTVACLDGGFQCINEENMKQHLAMLENMKRQHAFAKKQDAQRKAEFAQQQINEETQRQEQARLEQLREQASIPSVILGTYPCYNQWFNEVNVPPVEGEASITDVNTSYMHVYPNEEPYRVMVYFNFDNIISVSKADVWDTFNVNFKLRDEIWIRSGDTAGFIRFGDESIRDAYFDQLIAAKKEWDEKHPELR